MAKEKSLTTEAFNELVQKSIKQFEALSPEEQAAHREEQKQSWLRGEMAMGESSVRTTPEERFNNICGIYRSL